ncbi:MAG: YbaB/EbfC family nucleoid-associated protein [Bacilli bacterium]|nr:YbaB/EbfC family nucleoid-associated protein [Bacilli bacterium]
MNMQAILKQAQTIQKDMMKAQEQINSTIFEGSSSLVNIKMNGKKEVIEVKIDKSSSMDSEDLEALEDMIMLAVNDAAKKVDKMTEEKMGKYTNAMPGLF